MKWLKKKKGNHDFSKSHKRKRRTVVTLSTAARQAPSNQRHAALSQRLHSLMTAVFSGRFRELMMTKPKPSFSLRLMTTSLVCRAAPSEVAATMVAVGTETTGGPEAAAPSLRGELCCVDTEPGLRPLTGHGSPGGRGQAGVSQ